MDNIELKLLFDESDLQNSSSEEILNKIADAFDRAQEEGESAFEGIGDSIKQQNQLLKKYGKQVSEAEKESAKLEKSTSILSSTFDGLGANIGGLDLTVGGLKDTYSKYRDILTSTNTQLRAGVGITATQREGVATLTRVLGGGTRAFTAVAKAVRIFRLALISTGIGAIVIAIASLLSFLTRTQKGVNAVNKVFAGLGAATDVVIDRLSTFGEVIFDAVKNPKQAIKDLGKLLLDNLINRFKGVIDIALATGKALSGLFTLDLEKMTEAATEAEIAINQILTGLDAEQQKNVANGIAGIVEEIEKEVAAATALEGRRQALERLEIAQILRSAKLKKEIKEQNLLVEDTTKGFAEREAAAVSAFELSQKLLEQEVGILGERARILEQQQALGNNLIEDDRELAEAKAEIFQKQEEIFELQTTLQNKLNALRAEETRQTEALAKAYEEVKDKVVELAQASELEQLSPEQRIEAERKVALTEIDNLEALAKERAKAAGEQFELEKEFAKLRLGVEINSQLAIQKLEADAIKKKRDAKDKELDDNVAQIKKEEQLALAALDIQTEATDKSISLEEEKERKRLEIQQEALRQQLEIAKARFGPDSIETQLIETQIKAIDNALDGLGKDGFVNKILTSLGLDDEDISQIVGAVGSIFDEVIAGINRATELEIQQQDELIAKSEERISELQSILDTEADLKKRGRANDYDATLKLLEDEQAALKASEDKKVEIQKKAAKQQLIIDSAKQAANLATAITQIFAANSGIPFVGIALAAASIASMIGLYSKYKAEVGQLREGLHPVRSNGKGFKMKGRTHDQGGNPFLHDGILYEAEKDEILVGTKQSKKHSPFLFSLMEGKYDNLDLKAIADSASKLSGAYGGSRIEATQQFNVFQQQNLTFDNAKMTTAFRTALREENAAIISAFKQGKSITGIGDGKVLEVQTDGNGDVVHKRIVKV